MRPYAPLQPLDETFGGRHKFFRIHGLPPHDVVVLGRPFSCRRVNDFLPLQVRI